MDFLLNLVFWWLFIGVCFHAGSIIHGMINADRRAHFAYIMRHTQANFGKIGGWAVFFAVLAGSIVLWPHLFIAGKGKR